ncbi:tetraacyldisaccharide 4'-kinase [Thermosulfuriphilus sp.]
MKALAPLGKAYAGLMAWRARLYRQGLFPSYRLPIPVISVGNLSLGGTGKTPFTLWLARRLLSLGHRPVILSRGYGRKSRGLVVVSAGAGPLVGPEVAGDEPYLLASRLPQALVVVGKDRYQAGLLAIQRFDATVAILDDGFQHLRLLRDLDLVLISPEASPETESVFPAGLLREGASALCRADILIISKANLFPNTEIKALKEYLNGLGLPVFKIFYQAVGLFDLSGRPVSWPRSPWGAFCGLARPEAFFDLLKAIGRPPAAELSFTDHHHYKGRDLRRLGKFLEEKGLSAFVTTEKDAVKLKTMKPSWPLYFLRLDLKVPKDLEEFIILKLSQP